MTVTVRSTDHASVALATAGSFLRADPFENNLVLSLLAQRAARPEEGRYWTATDGGEVVGFAFRSPTRFRTVVSAPRPGAVEALVDVMAGDVMAGDVPELSGVMAGAATAAAFAGQWAERRRVPAWPVEGQRLYRLVELHQPGGVPGGPRQAGAGDRDLLVGWAGHFMAEIGGHPLPPEEVVDRHLATGGLWVWEAGEPVSVAAASPPVAGVSRIGYVYTPPGHRRQGYAAACVAAVSERVQAGGSECVLYTQLQNPTSNAVYRRLGYRPVVELVVYRFG